MSALTLTLALTAGWNMHDPAEPDPQFDMLAERSQPAAALDPATTVPQERTDPQAAHPLRRRLVVYTADWCGPCRVFKSNALPRLAAAGWRIGPDPHDHIALVDCQTCLPAGIDSLPTFVLLEGDVEISRACGTLDEWDIGRLVKGYSERPTGTAAPAGDRDRRSGVD